LRYFHTTTFVLAVYLTCCLILVPLVLQEAIARAKAKKEQAAQQPDTQEPLESESTDSPAAETEVKAEEPVSEEPEDNEEPEPEDNSPEPEQAIDAQGNPVPKMGSQKFGVQTAKGKVIQVFRNGDKHHTGDRFVIHAKKYKNLEQLYTDITMKVSESTGPVRKLIYLNEDGTKKIISSLDEIRDKSNVIACGAGAFKADLGEAGNLVHEF
jgi:hypothetical protein